MATAEEGGATAKTTTTTTNTTTTSSYGGGEGGAGGKFRRKPFRKPTTPYDRPPVALSRNDSSGSWLKKLVMDPASKLISYGAHRLFASLSRKRLPAPPPPPPPPPPQILELNPASSDGLPAAVPNSQHGAQDPAGGECHQLLGSSGRNGISELEQLLKQKTFTRSEIDHLTELLHSRAGEVSLRDDGKRNGETASDFGKFQQFESSPLGANRNEGDRHHGVVSTPISNSKVLVDSIASPAELAKAYMGSKPSKVSPSMLGKHSQVTREDTRLLGNMRVASKSPSLSLTTKTAAGASSPENGFIKTPSSLRRSAIYKMSRSLYSKGSGINHNSYAGLTMPSTSLSLVENGERSEPKSMTLKRRSYVLDDEVGSDGPIRRIRQKSYLISSGIAHADGVGSSFDALVVSSRPKLPLIGDSRHVPKTVEENTDNSKPSTSYAQVPPKSSEVAARILGHLEKLTPKEKSSQPKLVAVRPKSPFKLSPSMLRGQALRSMENASSSELLLNVQDDNKFESRSDVTISDAHDSTYQEQGKVEENGPVESSVPSDMRYSVINSDSALSLTSWVRNETSDSVVENGISQPQIKRAFRMSAPEDFVELDDDVPCDGHALPSVSEGRGQLEAHLKDSKFSPAGAPKLLETTRQPEVKSSSGLVLSKTSELSSAVPGAASLGEGSNGITTPALEEVAAATQSAVLPPSVAPFNNPKAKETDNPPPIFSFSSKVADKFPSLTSESSSRTPETKPESPSSLLNISAPTGSLAKIPEPEKGGNLKSLVAEDRNGKSDTVSSVSSNGRLVSCAPAGSLTVASSNNTKEISTGGPAIFPPSISVSNFVPSDTGGITSAASTGSIFGAAAVPTVFGGSAFKSDTSLDPSTKVSVASTAIIPAEGDMITKPVTDPSSGSSSISLANGVTFGTASSGNIISGFSPSASYTTANSDGTVSQGTSVHSFSFASPPSADANGSTSSVAPLSSSQHFKPIMSFGFSSSASSSDTVVIATSSGPTSSVFGVNATAVSGGTSGSSSSVAAPSMFSFGFSSSSSTNAVGSTGGATPVFSFGLSSSVSASVTNTTSSFGSSSSSTNAVGSNGVTTPLVFSFSASSSVPASVTNTTSSSSSGTLGIFNFGGISSSSSSAINSDSAPANNAFGSSWQTPKFPIFGSTLTSATSATGFSFSASSAPSALSNAAPVVFNSSTAPSSSPLFPFTSSSASGLSAPSPSPAQPVFGNPTGFAASPGNNDQMNAEDSMAEDPVQSTVPSVPVFGQTSVSPSPSGGFVFGSSVPSQPNPFQFGGQQNQVAPQNPSMFQGSGSLEFNAGGSFSLGSGGGDKSARKFVKISRSKNRKK